MLESFHFGAVVLNYFLLSIYLHFVYFFFLFPLGVKLGILFGIFLVSWGQPVLLCTYLLELHLLHPINSGKFCFHFCSPQCSFWFPFWSIDCLVVCCLVFKYLCFFPVFFLWLISSFMPLWLKKVLNMISIFLKLSKLVLWTKYNLSWTMFYVHLKKCIFCNFWKKYSKISIKFILFKVTIIILISVWMTYPLMLVGIKILYCYYITVLLYYSLFIH